MNEREKGYRGLGMGLAGCYGEVPVYSRERDGGVGIIPYYDTKRKDSLSLSPVSFVTAAWGKVFARDQERHGPANGSCEVKDL